VLIFALQICPQSSLYSKLNFFSCTYSRDFYSWTFLFVHVICFFCVAAGVLLFCRSSSSALGSADHFWWWMTFEHGTFRTGDSSLSVPTTWWLHWMTHPHSTTAATICRACQMRKGSSNFTPQVKEARNQSQIFNRKSISRNTTHRQSYHLQAKLTGVKRWKANTTSDKVNHLKTAIVCERVKTTRAEYHFSWVYTFSATPRSLVIWAPVPPRDRLWPSTPCATVLYIWQLFPT